MKTKYKIILLGIAAIALCGCTIYQPETVGDIINDFFSRKNIPGFILLPIMSVVIGYVSARYNTTCS